MIDFFMIELAWMMSYRKHIACIGIALALSGCATHPLPGDYVGNHTVAIVEKVRCEAAMAIEDKAIEKLRNYTKDSEGHDLPAAVIFHAKNLADRLESNRNEFASFKPSELATKEGRAFYSRYIETGIALEFTFDITEDTTANAEVDFARALTAGSVSLPFKAGSDRSRQNTRKFQIVDKFSTLLHDLPDCGSRVSDAIYPIQGSVGLREVISTFVDLNESANLQPDAKAPVFGDTLIFKTTLSESVIPQLTLTPSGRVFRISGATLTESASRIDSHMLNVGLSRETAKTSPSLMAAPFGNVLTAQSVFTKRRNIEGQPISGAEQRAAEAIRQQRIDNFYDRLGQLPLR